MASLRTHKVFSAFRQRVNAIFEHYIACSNSSLAAGHAAQIRVVHQDFTRFLLQNPDGKGLKQRLFSQVVARVIRQKAEGALPASWKQIVLVQLCLHVFDASPGNLQGVLNVQTLISEVGNRFVSLGTELSEFIRDGNTESVDVEPTLARFTNLGCFVSAITAEAAGRPVYPLNDHDLRSLGRVGVDLVLGILRADSNFDIAEGVVRLKLFRVVIDWFEENKEILFLEIYEEHDLYLCQNRLFNFWDSDWLEFADRDGEFLILAEHASQAALRCLKNLENRFGHQKLLELLEEYADDWAEWILNSLED